MDKQSFAQRLQNLHANEYPGQSVRDAALESGISYRTLGGLMNGTGSKPTFATKTKLAAYYGVTVEWLDNPTENETVDPIRLDEILRLAEELYAKFQALPHQAPPPPADRAIQTSLK